MKYIKTYDKINFKELIGIYPGNDIIDSLMKDISGGDIEIIDQPFINSRVIIYKKDDIEYRVRYSNPDFATDEYDFYINGKQENASKRRTKKLFDALFKACYDYQADIKNYNL